MDLNWIGWSGEGKSRKSVRFGNLTLECFGSKQAQNIGRVADMRMEELRVWFRQSYVWEEKKLINWTEMRWSIEL